MQVPHSSRAIGLILIPVLLILGTIGLVILGQPEGGKAPPLSVPAAMPSGRAAPDTRKPVIATADGAAPADNRAELVGPKPQDVTLLHVRVVDTAGAAVTSGALECELTMPQIDSLPIDRVGLDIAGTVTDVGLPPDTNTCLVTVSAAGFPPAQARAQGLRRAKRGAPPITGRVDRDLRIVVGIPIEGPTFSGAIFVDGQRRVPARLKLLVITEDGRADALVDALTASYIVPRPRSTPKEFLVDSGETTPCTIPIPPPDAQGNWHVDLQLKTGRKLVLQALDAENRTPAAGVSLTYKGTIVRERIAGRVVSHDQLFRVNTDADGLCVFTCLPLDGGIAVSETKDFSEFAPLLALKLTPDSPAEFHETVLVHASRASVWGVLADSRGEVLRMPVREGSHGGIGERVAVDAKGRWSFECDAASEWFVWLSEDKTRVSQLADVHVTQPRPYGPIALQRQSMREVSLRLVHVPPSGRVGIWTEEDTGEPSRYECVMVDGEEIARSLKMSGPARLRIDCCPVVQGVRTRAQQVVHVDPDSTHELVVDLHGESSRAVALRVNAEFPDGEALLRLQKLDSFQVPLSETIELELADGKSVGAVPITSGTYVYLLDSSNLQGAFCGVLRVSEDRAPGVLSIDWTGQPVPKQSLGFGLEWKNLDGIPCSTLPANLRRIVWPRNLSAATQSLLIPDHAEYEVLN